MSVFALKCRNYYDMFGIKRTDDMKSNTKDVSVRRAKRVCRDIVKLNTFTHFITLTFDRQRTDPKNIAQVKQRVRSYTDRLVKNGIGYILTFEPHESDNESLHAHLIVSNYKDRYIKRVKAKHYYHNNCSFWNWGFSKVKDFEQKHVGYVLKYIMKDNNFYGRYYYSSNNLIKKPKVYKENSDHKVFGHKIKSEWYDIDKES